MLRAGQSLPPKGLSTLRFDAGRFPPTPAACYRASWQLPGPDSHRLADTSLRVDYLNATTSKGDITSRTHAAGHTKVPLGVARVASSGLVDGSRHRCGLSVRGDLGAQAGTASSRRR